MLAKSPVRARIKQTNQVNLQSFRESGWGKSYVWLVACVLDLCAVFAASDQSPRCTNCQRPKLCIVFRHFCTLLRFPGTSVRRTATNLAKWARKARMSSTICEWRERERQRVQTVVSLVEPLIFILIGIASRWWRIDGQQQLWTLQKFVWEFGTAHCAAAILQTLFCFRK